MKTALSLLIGYNYAEFGESIQRLSGSERLQVLSILERQDRNCRVTFWSCFGIVALLSVAGYSLHLFGNLGTVGLLAAPLWIAYNTIDKSADLRFRIKQIMRIQASDSK